MGLSKKEIYEKIAKKEISVEEGIRLIKNIESAVKENIDTSSQDKTDNKEPIDKTSEYIIAVQNDIINLINQISGIDKNDIGVERGFFDQGLESMHLMTLVKKIEAKMQVELYPTLLFEYKTIKDLTTFLLKEFGNKYPINTKPINRSKKEIHVKKQVPKTKTKQTGNVQKDYNKKGNIDIAIIGLAGKYPMADNMDQFWENLKAGKDCITEVPGDRWNWEDFYDPDPVRANDGKIYCKEGGFVSDVDKFDPLFFNISPREAELMDPQERWFLQISWKAIEDAGYTPESLGERVGVFAGITTNTYLLFGPEEWQKGNPVIPRTLPWSVANRVSYCLNLTGPSVPVDTACSSSLTAIHYACESIKNNECDAAIAGGVNFYLHYSKFLMLCQNKMLSPDGRSYTFGEKANGFGPGEGVGVIILKSLTRAQEDRDHIYGVIKASSLNHGGRASGYHVPDPLQQTAVIVNALERGSINPETISYIEAHGTGTELGDPIEVQGLAKAFLKFTDKTNFCALGSVKSNIGHLEAAAGIAGITKILLQMKYKQLVPSLHTETLNSKIEFKHTAFYVQRKLEEWKKPQTGTGKIPLRAGISSFGAGGANAHIIIEEYVVEKTSFPSLKTNIFVLSARNKTILLEYAKNCLHYLQQNPDEDHNSICYTLQTGREYLIERLAFICHSNKSIIDILKAYINESDKTNIFCGNNKAYKSNVSSDRSIEPKEDDLVYLAESWVMGNSIDWNIIYNGNYPYRISLPTYPFLLKSYWLPREKKNNIFKAIKLHPLITSNISTLKEQKFNAILSAKDFFIKDHVVAGQMVFPGVAYLEMARAAAEFALEEKISGLSNIVWFQPIVVENTKEIFINFYHGKDILFRIYSKGENKIQHCQGTVLLNNHAVSNTVDKINISEIKGRCTAKIDSEKCYNRFINQGLNYGKGFQGIKELFYNEREVLAAIQIPEIIKFTFKDFILHPTIMDAALQSVIGFYYAQNIENNHPSIPFSVKQLEIIREFVDVCFAYVTVREGTFKPDNAVNKFTILLLNSQGDLIVTLQEFIIRQFKNQIGSINPEETFQIEINKIITKVVNNTILPEEAAVLLEEKYD